MKPVAFLVLIAGLAGVGRAEDLAGVWRIDLPKRGGVTLHTYLIIEGQNGAIDGSVVMNDSVRIPMRKPHREGDEGVFDTDWNTDFRVRRDGDRLRVKIIYGKKDSVDTFAVRVPLAEVEPPDKRPLPQFAPLPPNGLAPTPPMGWNSWNHFAERVDDRVVRETADAMVMSGMAAAGYTYVVIDDTWEGERDAAGNLQSNAKFPDMKALADYVHAKGLKLGIYSSPGPRTCGGYIGSYGHEEQDAKTFAAWGVDYLKYDWCSAARLYGYSKENLRAGYLPMGRALEECGRPIVYSLCEYGAGEVWEWGPQVAGNLWRTTGDIQDNWKSMAEIGFDQGAHAPYAGPGHWNDPDMLEVGNGGMTPVEYRTHFSLWCLLAAPLMAGNDLRTMDTATVEILTNREVIAVDQDALGRQGTRIAARDGIEVWAKPLEDGGLAVGIFNRNEADASGGVTWHELGLAAAPKAVRDLWARADVKAGDDGYAATVPAHGVAMLRLK
ncbi:MAG TPA: glycoside hydrolase family 27 protein [Opitutus sp.]|nr:glycoside hydrolase family 27 protein [Opitutus sp.]